MRVQIRLRKLKYASHWGTYTFTNIPIVGERFVGFIDAFGELPKTVWNSKSEFRGEADEDGAKESEDEDDIGREEEVEEDDERKNDLSTSLSEGVNTQDVNIWRLVVKDLQAMGLLDLLKGFAVGTVVLLWFRIEVLVLSLVVAKIHTPERF